MALQSLSEPKRRGPPARAWWAAAWAAAVAGGAAALALSSLTVPLFAWLGLACGIAPALVSLAAARAEGERPQLVVTAAWGAFGGAAAILCGGLSGPLAAWCLAPLAAAAATGRTRLAALGGGLSVAALGFSTLATLALPAPVLSPWVDFSLRALAFITAGAGLAAGVVLLQRAQAREFWRLAESEARIKRILEDQPYLVLVLNAGGQVRAVFGQPAPGVPDQRLDGRPIFEAADPEDRRRIEETVRQARAYGFAQTRFTPAGAPGRAASLVVRRVTDTRLVAAVGDASGEADREAALERARADADAQNAGKSRFLANMSHELRTPLNAIMGFSDIMRSQLFGPLSDRYGEYADLIHESGGHLLELINDVLDMSKIEADRYELSRERFDAREPLAAVLRLMRGQAERAGVDLRAVLPRDAVEVDADARALKQIALNLISNALKFTPRGGSVTITLQAADEALELIVADTGVGIGPDDLDRLGRPYEQAGDADQRAAGTGLGLSLVRAFAELHGGGVGLESRLGEGTTVTVRLPVLAGAETPEPPGAGSDLLAQTLH